MPCGPKDLADSNLAAQKEDPMKMKLATALALLLALLAASTANAQANAANYGFTTTTTGSLTDMSSGTTTLLNANLDDTASPVTPLGFEFFFMGVRQGQFSINDNGVLRFALGAQTAAPYKPLAQAAPQIVTAYGADQRTHLGDGKVHFKVNGTAPNRVAIIEWLNNQSNFNAGGTADLTYQVRLFETSGCIEFVYGSMTMSAAGAADVNSRDPHIGFSSSNTAGTVGSVTAAQSGTPAPTFNGASATPVANLYTAGAITVLTSATDGARRTFSFCSPAPTPAGALSFTGVTQTTMTVNWGDSPNEVGYAIYSSTDGGINYTFAGVAPQNATSFAASGLAPSTTYDWRVVAFSEGALAAASTGTQATPAPNPKSSAATGLWSNPATWTPAGVPAAGDAVTIASGHTVTIDTAAVAFSVTIASGGILEFEQTTARTLTTGGDVNVQAGGTFQSNPAGTQTGHNLSTAGNLVNDGTLDFSTNANTAGAIITFTSTANTSFSGTGATTDIRQITVNKGITPAAVMELMPANFTVRGVTTDTVVGGWLVMTNGTIKISGTFTGTSRVFAVAAYTIPVSFGFWLNNPNYTVAAQAGNAVNNGVFRLSQGTFNQGTLVTHSFRGAAGAVFTIESTGVLNCAGQFSPQTAVTYNQSGGTVNVGLVGNSQSNFATFELFSTAATFNMTGGTINIVQASTGATQIDYQNLATNIVAATGTVRVGTGATVTKFTFNIRGNLPNLIIDNTTNNKLVTATAQVNLNGTTLINTGTSLTINGQICLVIGSMFTNNGTLTGTTAGTRFYFLGGSGPTTYNGTGVVTAPLDRLRGRQRRQRLDRSGSEPGRHRPVQQFRRRPDRLGQAHRRQRRSDHRGGPARRRRSHRSRARLRRAPGLQPWNGRCEPAVRAGADRPHDGQRDAAVPHPEPAQHHQHERHHDRRRRRDGERRGRRGARPGRVAPHHRAEHDLLQLRGRHRDADDRLRHRQLQEVLRGSRQQDVRGGHGERLLPRRRQRHGRDVPGRRDGGRSPDARSGHPAVRAR